MSKFRYVLPVCGFILMAAMAGAQEPAEIGTKEGYTAVKPGSEEAFEQECRAARQFGLLDRYYEPATREQRDLRRRCQARGAFTRYCVVNLDGDSDGSGFTGVLLDGMHQYGSTYSSGTTDDSMRDDLVSQISANPYFDATPVGDTTLVVQPVGILFGIGCGPVMSDSNAKIGTGEYDWNDIIVVESDPQDTTVWLDIENGSEPTSSISDFTVTTWWGTGTYSSGIDDDVQICAGVFTWGPGFWEGVGYTALVQEAVDGTLSCSTTDSDLRLACQLFTS